jgi:hypothetical protein
MAHVAGADRVRHDLFSNRLLELAAILMLSRGFVKGFRKGYFGESDPDHIDKKRFI